MRALIAIRVLAVLAVLPFTACDVPTAPVLNEDALDIGGPGYVDPEDVGLCIDHGPDGPRIRLDNSAC